MDILNINFLSKNYFIMSYIHIIYLHYKNKKIKNDFVILV